MALLPKREIERLRQRVKQLEELATRDPLTGLYNRRGLTEQINAIIPDVQRYLADPDHPKRQSVIIRALSLIEIDLDHFKAINDSYGHDVGDLVLIQVGQLLGQNTRSIDLVARLGGEEIAVVLVGAPKTEAAKIAENLRRDIEQLDIKADQKSLKISASLGVATLEAKDSLDVLIKRADKALYQAKKAGRNQVRTA